MQRNIVKRILLNAFWLSLLLHILLLLSFSGILFFQPQEKEEKKKPPNLFVPAYVYKGAITPSRQQKAAKPTQTAAADMQPKTNEVISALKDKQAMNVAPTKRKQSPQKSILAATREVLESNRLEAVTTQEDSEPIFLIGDTNQVADPLIKLMGRALSKHFAYPRAAGELGVRGRVIVKLTLHPEGYFSNVIILRSSDSQDLDAAALYAINSAPTIVGVERFIAKPKSFVIGFIFR